MSPLAQPPAPIPASRWRSSAWRAPARSLPAASAGARSSASSAPGSPQARAAPHPPTQRLPRPPACQTLRCSARVCGVTWVQPTRRAARRLWPRGSRRREWLLVQWAPAFSIHVLMNHLTKMQPNSRRICSEQCGFVEGMAALRFPRQDPNGAAKLLCASQEPARRGGRAAGMAEGSPRGDPGGDRWVEEAGLRDRVLRCSGTRSWTSPNANDPVGCVTHCSCHRLGQPPAAGARTLREAEPRLSRLPGRRAGAARHQLWITEIDQGNAGNAPSPGRTSCGKEMHHGATLSRQGGSPTGDSPHAGPQGCECGHPVIRTPDPFGGRPLGGSRSPCCPLPPGSVPPPRQGRGLQHRAGAAGWRFPASASAHL